MTNHEPNTTNSELNKLVSQRLSAAFIAGVKLSAIIEATGISSWQIRAASRASAESNPYKYSSGNFSDSECNAILAALDSIKAAI